MKKLAPEMDSLMWTLAEQGNERAIDEFGIRHPELRSELVRRISMVKGLRGAKQPAAASAAAIPRFVPRDQHKYPAVSRRASVGVGALVLAAVAAAAFTLTTMMNPPHHQPTKQVPGRVFDPTSEINNNAPPIPPVDNSNPVVTGNTSEASANQGDTKPGAMQTDRMKRIQIRIDQSPLFTVFESMSLIGGVPIIPGRGMQNPSIAVDYENMTTMEILQDLGRRYDFTPVEQQDGSILIVTGTSRTTLPGNQGSIRTQKIGG